MLLNLHKEKSKHQETGCHLHLVFSGSLQANMRCYMETFLGMFQDKHVSVNHVNFLATFHMFSAHTQTLCRAAHVITCEQGCYMITTRDQNIPQLCSWEICRIYGAALIYCHFVMQAGLQQYAACFVAQLHLDQMNRYSWNQVINMRLKQILVENEEKMRKYRTIQHCI